LDRIQIKLKRFKQFFKGWGFNRQGEQRKKKLALQEELLSLELLEETQDLDLTQLQKKLEVHRQILEILTEEELYWCKRAHSTWLLEGDNNTEFFHRVANGRKRKHTIMSLMDGDNVIEGDSDLIAHATDYYKTLFGPAARKSFPLNEGLWEDGEKVSEKDNVELVKPFSEIEIKEALLQMEKNKAAGPDKIPADFYQHCWDIIKDVLEMFAEFHAGILDVSRMNYGIITLLHKIQDAEKIQQFRLICLLNCIYKWITKVLTLRLENIAEKLILVNQTAFMKRRDIINGIMALHEILHETKKNNEVGIVLKLDFEKAYDKVCWEFLFDCLKIRGFCEKWCSWIKQVVFGGTVSVKLNDQMRPYFRSYKGVRQGDPLSPIFFNFVADYLARMVRHSQQNGLITGLAENIIPKVWLSYNMRTTPSSA